MWPFLVRLLGFIPGITNTINGITSAIANERIAAISATTDKARIQAQENVATLQAKRDLMIAESTHSKLPILMQSLIAIGPAAVLLKIFLWDKVIGAYMGCVGITGPECNLYSTDALDGNLWAVVTAVVGFYFLSNVVLSGARILKA